MRRKVLAWSLIGFCVPIFWGVMGLVTFTLPQSIWSDIFWYAVYVTCPFWLLPTMPWWIDEMLMLVLNALLYGAIAYAVLSLRRGIRSWSNRSSPL
jgi:hypothetical protein